MAMNRMKSCCSSVDGRIVVLPVKFIQLKNKYSSKVIAVRESFESYWSYHKPLYFDKAGGDLLMTVMTVAVNVWLPHQMDLDELSSPAR